ncbi:hypothetical protein HUJ04_011231 [Dendroctonus ponderosae]|nr:hypothetical protein HUJ04_011231 [Dendroctonus ponderosae]
MRYLNDKVPNLSKNQVPQEIIDSLANQISKLSSSVPTVSEIYDILLSLESKWGILEGKLDDIRRVTELFTTLLLGHDEDNISIQVYDSSSANLKMGMEGLRDGLANVAAMVRKLSPKVVNSNQQRVRVPAALTSCSAGSAALVSSSTQTGLPPGVSSSPGNTDSPVGDSARKWHYVVARQLPVGFTATNVVNHVKEGLKSSDFVRCFRLISRDKDTEESTFKVGTLTRESAERLLGHSMWPRGARVEWSTESAVSRRVVEDRRLPTGGARVSLGPGLEGLLAAAPADYGNSRPRSVITITSDKQAIAACRTNSFANVKLPEGMPRDQAPSLDPLTPPIVKMTVASDRSKNSGRRYLIARLREPSILRAIRLYLAYLHDQPASVCYEGFTTTSIKVFLASEGLSIRKDALHGLYTDFHSAYGMGGAEVEADLSTYRSDVVSERTVQLQRYNESHHYFFSSGCQKEKIF